MKILVKDCNASKPWEIKNLTPFSNDEYIEVFNGKIHYMKFHRLGLGEFKSDKRGIEFKLEKLGRNYIIRTTIDNVEYELYAKIKLRKSIRIRFVQGKWPFENIELNIFLYSSISGIIGYLFSEFLHIIRC